MSQKGRLFTRSMALGLVLLGLMAVSRAEGTSDTNSVQTGPAIEDQPLTPYQTALLDYKIGKYADARTAIDIAEKAAPGDLPTEILKARILTELGDYPDGEKVLRNLLTPPPGPLEAQLALGDLFLRKRDFNGASKFYGQALLAKPGDPDIMLKMVYAKIGASDLLAAANYTSKLKPLDPDHPCYYFAKAALAQTAGRSQEADDDIQTSRTIYGITVTNHYLKTYLEVITSIPKGPATEITPPPLVNNPPK
ncbi:MAG: hypothetical protein LV480_03455 [Methylacidiphilales bacterium]|nr:hypothetical protein [Candidatus Methylacidiphilales bacterium]